MAEFWVEFQKFYLFYFLSVIVLAFLLYAVFKGQMIVIQWKGKVRVERVGYAVDLTARGVALITAFYVLLSGVVPMTRDIPYLLRHDYKTAKGDIFQTDSTTGSHLATQHIMVNHKEYTMNLYPTDFQLWKGKTVVVRYLPYSHTVMKIYTTLDNS